MSTKTYQLAFIALALVGAVGCNEQGFTPPAVQTSGVAPGNFSIPPKVDILLIEDDTGSAFESYAQIESQTQEFISGLQNQGWDFRFATIPLTTDRALTEAMASKYDANWGSEWQSPYPGATQGSINSLQSWLFKRPENYNGFLQTNISTVNGSHEPGLETIQRAVISRAGTETSFIRPDAMLAIVVLGNGNDTSRVNMCMRNDGLVVPCEAMTGTTCNPDYSRDPYQTYTPSSPACGSAATSFNNYRTAIASAKADPSQLKFYAAVPKQPSNSCRGAYARYADRYIRMATALGGVSYDICTQSLSSILSSVSSNLATQRIAFRTRYLFLPGEPNPSSIRVCRNHECRGDSDPDLIPQSSTNGWTYAGYKTNVYAIDYPVPMNLMSGWAIELHGNARLYGNETAGITFTPAGAH